MLRGEEVAIDGATGGFVGVHADEFRGGCIGGDAVLGEQALDLPGGGAIALIADLLPGGDLTCVIGGDGEGLQGLEVDVVRAVGVDQLGRGVAEAQALLDGAFGDTEAGGDLGDTRAALREDGEGLYLVRGVHGDADDVLGEGDLRGGRVGVEDETGDLAVDR